MLINNRKIIEKLEHLIKIFILHKKIDYSKFYSNNLSQIIVKNLTVNITKN